MNDIDKSMKYALSFGLGGAVLMPVIHESYALIGKTFAISVLALAAVFAAFKFHRLPIKEAIVGITASLGISGVLGACFYFLTHQHTAAFFQRVSKYNFLSITEQYRYYLTVAGIYLFVYVLYFLFYSVKRMAMKIRDNSDKTKDYIDNAFDEENQRGIK